MDWKANRWRFVVIALLVGVITGTYSSIFIASSIVVEWRDLDAKRRVAKAGGQAPIQPPNVCWA